MSFSPLDLSEILLHGDVSLGEAIYGYEEDRIEFSPNIHSDHFDDRPPSVVVGVNDDNELDWSNDSWGEFEENNNLENGIGWNTQQWEYEEEMNMCDTSENVEVMAAGEEEFELNSPYETMFDFDDDSHFGTLYDYDPNSRFEGIDDRTGDTNETEGGETMEDIVTISPHSMCVVAEEEITDCFFSPLQSSTSVSSTSPSSSFDYSPISPTVSVSSINPSFPSVCTASSSLDYSISHLSSSSIHSPFSPCPLTNPSPFSFSSLDPIPSIDSYSSLDYYIVADSSSPLDDSYPISSSDNSHISNPTCPPSPSSSHLSISSSPSVDGTVPLEVESITPIAASMSLGTLLNQDRAVSGLKVKKSRRKTRVSKKCIPSSHSVDKLPPQLAELLDLELELADCKTENERLLYCAHLINARRPSLFNIDAKLAIQKILREELRPSQAAFVFGLNIKNFMRQYHRLMAAADVERRKLEIKVIQVLDRLDTHEMERETNQRKGNRVRRQVYSAVEEIIDPVNDSQLLYGIFSIVFGHLFEGWINRRGIRETVLTLTNAISEGIRPSRRHVPKDDVSLNLNIENDVIPFYRRIVEEFKKIPELSHLVKKKTVMISVQKEGKE